MSITLVVMILGVLFLVASPRMVIVVPAGHAGVLFRPLSGGTANTTTLDEGAHLIFPWNNVTLYNIRLQTVNQLFDIITKDGLAINANIEVRFRITKAHVGGIHRHLGPNYVDVMLLPEVASNAREIASHFDAEQLYATKREDIQRKILKDTREGIRRENAYSAADISFVEVDDIFVKGITLPPLVATSIERKIEQYQRLIEFDYRVQTETKESQRKAIEGEGVAKLFANVGARDVPNYLKLASIEAMLKLAQSDGAKVVVMGDSRGGTPVIVNADAPPVQSNSKSANVPTGSRTAAEATNARGQDVRPAIAPKPAVKAEEVAAALKPPADATVNAPVVSRPR